MTKCPLLNKATHSRKLRNKINIREIKMTQTPVCLITTGGTIGSSIDSESVSVSQGEKQLREYIESFCTNAGWQLDITSAFNKNSEDLTPSDWLVLLQQVEQAVCSGHENIVITHGTDTMAYSAYALALCCARLPARIVLTGSCYTLDHPRSDVAPNLIGAFKTATEKQLPNGIYVSFCNSLGEVLVINALDIKPMNFDEQGFDGVYQQREGTFNNPQANFETDRQPRVSHQLKANFDQDNINRALLEKAPSRVFQLPCYPGMNASPLCSGIPADSFVIVTLYHSGTGPSLADNNSLIDAIEKRPDLTFILTPLPSKYVEKPYASSVALINAGALLTRDLQPHQLYTLLILGLSCSMTKQEIIGLLDNFQM